MEWSYWNWKPSALSFFFHTLVEHLWRRSWFRMEIRQNSNWDDQRQTFEPREFLVWASLSSQFAMCRKRRGMRGEWEWGSWNPGHAESRHLRARWSISWSETTVTTIHQGSSGFSSFTDWMIGALWYKLSNRQMTHLNGECRLPVQWFHRFPELMEYEGPI
jgi:hypothetical protein